MNYKEKLKKELPLVIFEKFTKYVQMIQETNQKFNLTGFSEDKIWEQGIYESLIVFEKNLSHYLNKHILDIGSGAGFPSIPFLLKYPNIFLTIYESNFKKYNFLQEVKNKLNLSFEIKNIRSEDAKDYEMFDIVTAKAVAPLPVLIEISHHLCKINGQFIFFKGPGIFKEIELSKKIIKKFKINFQIEKINQTQNQILIFEYIKKLKTPKGFPRMWKKIILLKK